MNALAWLQKFWRALTGQNDVQEKTLRPFVPQSVHHSKFCLLGCLCGKGQRREEADPVEVLGKDLDPAPALWPFAGGEYALASLTAAARKFDEYAQEALDEGNLGLHADMVREAALLRQWHYWLKRRKSA